MHESFQDEWHRRAGSYAERLRNLRYLQAPAINNTTVFDDFAVDQLTGGAGTDWFVYFSTDRPLDAAAGEEGLGMPL